MRIFSVVALMALALPVVAQADEPVKKKPDPNRQICRYERKLGTRLVTTKRCLTAAEWRQIERQNRLAIDIAQTARYKSF